MKLKLNPISIAKDPLKITGFLVFLSALNVLQYTFWCYVYHVYTPTFWLWYSIFTFGFISATYVVIFFLTKRNLKP